MNKKTIYPDKYGNYFLAGEKQHSISPLRSEKDFSLSTQISEVEDIELKSSAFINIGEDGGWIQTISDWLKGVKEKEKKKEKEKGEQSIFLDLPIEENVETFQDLLMQYVALMGNLFLAIKELNFDKQRELLKNLTKNRRKFIERMVTFKFSEAEIKKWYSPADKKSLFRSFTDTTVKLYQDYDNQDEAWKSKRTTLFTITAEIEKFWQLLKLQTYKQSLKLDKLREQLFTLTKFKDFPKDIPNEVLSGVFTCIWEYGEILNKFWSKGFPNVNLPKNENSTKLEEKAVKCLNVASVLGFVLDQLETK